MRLQATRREAANPVAGAGYCVKGRNCNNRILRKNQFAERLGTTSIGAVDFLVDEGMK